MLPFSAIFPMNCWRVISCVLLQFRLKAHYRKLQRLCARLVSCLTKKTGEKNPIIAHSSATISLSSNDAKTDERRFRCAFESHSMINGVTRKSMWIVKMGERKASKCRLCHLRPTNHRSTGCTMKHTHTHTHVSSYFQFSPGCANELKDKCASIFFSAFYIQMVYVVATNRAFKWLSSLHIHLRIALIMFIMFASRCMPNPIRAGFTVCNRMLDVGAIQSITKSNRLPINTSISITFSIIYSISIGKLWNFCLLLCRHTHRLTVYELCFVSAVSAIDLLSLKASATSGTEHFNGILKWLQIESEIFSSSKMYKNKHKTIVHNDDDSKNK